MNPERETYTSSNKSCDRCYRVENKLLRMEHEIDRLGKDFIHLQTDLEWVKRFFWIVATASIGGLITGIINILLATQ